MSTLTSFAEVLRICGAAMLCMVCMAVLRASDRAGIGGIIGVCMTVIFGLAAVRAAAPMLSALRERCVPFLGSDYAELMWRAMAVGMTVQLTSDTVRDAGESALADRVDMIGRAALLCIGMPLYEELFALAASLLRL